MWLLVILAAYSCLAALIPVGPLDFWWHMALGRDIALNGAVPTVDTYSWTLPPDTPFFYQSWLSEWLFYRLYQFGGLGLIVVLRNGLLLVAYGVLGLDARRRSGSWRLAALAVMGAALLTLNNLTVRPQMFSWLPFALTWALLGAYTAGQLRRRWLLGLPLIMSLWVNLHGAFAIGLGLIAVTMAGETLKHLVRRGRRVPLARLLWLWLVSALSLLAVFVNPRGSDVLGYVGNLVGNPAVRQLVIEWQPTDLTTFPGILLPLALVLAALCWVRRPQRFDLTDALLLIVFSWLAWNGVRNLIWFGMVAWPIIAGLAARAPQLRPRRQLQLPLLNHGLALSLLVPLLIVQPPFKATLTLPAVFNGLGRSTPEGTLIDSSTPVKAVQWLQAHPLPSDARLFHDMGYGSYLIWALPQVRVCADPRIELYPLEHWQRYQRIARGEHALAELDRWAATHALLSRSEQPALITVLAASGSGWRRVYDDEQTVFFERSTEKTLP
jgi:hypothetical protein